ncbi:unnamed protein product [Staurois parvus]|uniref:Uncharacterized protein n=1 Tax=Staurois parvus TaxID=386267 RepID=A0ABN9FY05_9NEOB|nr:unnamed protein product [Staurois parvus]
MPITSISLFTYEVVLTLIIHNLRTKILFVQFALPQGWTDNSWSPQAIGDHGAPVCLRKLKKSL